MPRFDDQQAHLHEFTDECWVACPRCGERAVSRAMGEPKWNGPRRLTCTRCAHVADWHGDRIATGDAHDPHFGLPLWLRAPCCGQTLWAYNPRHLDFLADYIGATLRERARGDHGWANASLASRLPKWMQLARHRDEVRKGIERLRARLPAATG